MNERAKRVHHTKASYLDLREDAGHVVDALREQRHDIVRQAGHLEFLTWAISHRRNALPRSRLRTAKSGVKVISVKSTLPPACA